MKINKIFKKILATTLAVATLCGGINIFRGNITANAVSNPVQMYNMDYSFYRYGIYQYTVYIQVDSKSAANKAVYVHHATNNGWTDTAASFFMKLDDNTEIWKAYISGVSTNEYAIKYVGDGQTYWDNNNGNNYTLSNVAGASNVKAIRRSPSVSYNCIRAVVNNLGYGKKVILRYTLDNWVSFHEIELSYVSSVSGTNEELWAVQLNDLVPDNVDSFQYCIRYEVNGQTYWDNNFGSNYDYNYYRSY